MWDILFARCAKLLIVDSGLCEAEVAIGAAKYLVSIGVILAIILPEANGADLVSPALVERLVATAWATK